MNRIFSRRLLWGCLTVLPFLAGCMPKHKNILLLDETKLKTQETWLGPGWRFHQLAHDPHGQTLPFPGIVIGVEKSKEVDETDLLDDKCLSALDEKSQKLGRKIVGDRKTMVVTHVVDYRPADSADPVPGRIRSCFVYNLYSRRGHDPRHLLAPYDACPDSFAKAGGWSAEAQEVPDQEHTKATDGWIAMARAREILAQRIREAQAAGRPITHILVFVMGWNTAQDEAMNNYSSLAGNLYDQVLKAREHTAALTPGERTTATAFNPLMVGLTWPSYWKGILMNNSPFSYGNKAHDADEIGMSWLGALVHDVLPSLRAVGGDQLRIVGVGHSFGARALSRAVFSGPIIKLPGRLNGDVGQCGRLRPQQGLSPAVDLFVGLEGAFSVNRFLAGEGDEGSPYAERLGNVGHTLLTASENDLAVNTSFWTTFVGDDEAYDEVCGKGGKALKLPAAKGLFACVVADAQGNAQLGGNGSAPITYVNANDLIYFNMVGTGGGGHSDIYRPETARLLWNAIVHYAPVGGSTKQ